LQLIIANELRHIILKLIRPSGAGNSNFWDNPAMDRLATLRRPTGTHLGNEEKNALAIDGIQAKCLF